MMIMNLMLFFIFIIINYLKLNLILFIQNMFFFMFLIFIMYMGLIMNFIKIYWFLYLDYYSYFLIILTLWILSMSMMYSMNFNYKNLYIINMLILLMSLIFTFLCMNYFLFYFFFEFSMIPTLLLIIGWGSYYERIESGMYMFMYMMFSSLPMIIIIFFLFNSIESLNMVIMMNLNLINNLYMYIYLMLAFLVKLPMFMFHLWLPKAHVEAPITGSMILAGIMLKLGGYGLLRVLLMMEKMLMFYNYILMSISLFGSLYISLICLRQIDMKMLIAYSSVVHMGMMICNLLTLTMWGYMSSLIMMISHGLCSSGLFCLVNMNYTRLMSRSIMLNKGLMNLMPSMSLMWFILCIFNMASPPSLNLFSEMMMINNLLMWSMMMLLIIILLSFFNVLYMMYFYSIIQHGIIFKNMNKFMFIKIWEYLLIILHIFPLIYLIFMF